MASKDAENEGESENDEESEKTADVNSYQILSINEINYTCLLYEDCTIRTWGKVISHDIHKQQAIIMDDTGDKLCVNTAKIEPYGFTLGFYYNLIGDMVKNEESIMMLQVRAVTCINELDIDMFVKALELRRKFLNEKVLCETEVRGVFLRS